MKTKTLVCTVFTFTVLTLAARSQALNVSLNVCNDSKTHGVNIAQAWFGEGGNGMFIDKAPYHSKGWKSIAPGTCSMLVRDWAFTARSQYWLHVDSDKRQIARLENESTPAALRPIIRQSRTEFCIDHDTVFYFSYRSLDNTAASCGPWTGLVVYPIEIGFPYAGNFLLHINPDPWISREKPEVFPSVKLGDNLPLAEHSTKKAQFVGAFFKMHAAMYAASEEGRAVVLTCDYQSAASQPSHFSESLYWYKTTPKELPEWIAQDKEGELALIGTKALEKCPVDSHAAARLDRAMYVEYKNSGRK